MSSETTLYTTLTGAAAVTAIVGAGSAARIYPDTIPQDAVLPAVAYARAETEYLTTVHSSVPAKERATLAVWCLAATRAGADALADAVLTAAAAAQFTPISRRADYDDENEIWVTELGVSHWT